jgi:Flp pilus assembly protein TadB
VIRPASRRLLGLPALAVVLLLITGEPAGAAPAPKPGVRLTGLRASDQQLRFVLQVTGLPAGGTVDPASVRVSAGGQLLHLNVQSAAGAPSTATVLPAREVMLVVDASGSMLGSRLTAAKAAAASYAQNLPADVRLGLVSFSDRPKLVLAPTVDRTALRAALGQVSASGDTALYDAVLTAVTAFGVPNASLQRRILIVSDGADTTSRNPLSAATSALTGAGIGVDAVGIELSAGQREVLRQLTAAGAGQVLASSGLSQLQSAFVQAARTFSRQLAVTADLPAGLAGQRVSVTAEVVAAGTRLRAHSTITLPALASPSAATGGTAPSSRPAGKAVPFGLLAVTFLALLGTCLLVVLVNPRSKQPGQQTRLEQLATYQWSASPSTAVPSAPVEGAVATAALSLADRALRSGRFRSRIAADLERAGLRMPPQEWLLLRISLCVALTAVVGVLTGSLVLGLLLGTLLGWLITRLVLSSKASRRCSAFAEQLPDALQLVAASLRSGFSLFQALDGVVREGSQPAAGEFARALTEARLGVELEVALDGVAQRMKCRDLSWVVMAVRISHDVGGNLAEVLLTTVDTIRARAQLKRQVRALSAEGRLSAYVLIGLPIFVAGWFSLVRPQYLRPLYTQSAGIVMLVIAVAGVVIGSWWMSRIVKVEV